jgi:hypothetical protein
MSGTLAWTVSFVLTSPAYFFVGKWMFGSWEEFWDCVIYWFKPDIFSWFQGDFVEDFIAEMRLFLWSAISFSTTFGIYWLLTTFIA